jgi:hypothetical protein
MRRIKFSKLTRRVVSVIVSALLAFMIVQPALAAEKAGVILIFSGKVEIINGTITRPATLRAALYSGETIVTGEGQVQIRFEDGTLLTLYRDTKFSVDDYHYGNGQGDRAQFSLLNGLMHTLTGLIDKNNYQVKTRLATLGVRGTEYSAQLNNVLEVSVDQGRVEIANAGGTIQIGAGGRAIVTGPNVIPKPNLGGKIDLPMHGGGGRPAGGGPPPPGSAPPPPPPAGTSTF